MTEHILPFAENFPRASKPEDLPAVFAAAFNTGIPELIDSIYEPQGLFIRSPGEATAGAERLAANAKMVALGAPIEVRPRYVYVVDDIALLIVEWSISGTGAAGERIDLRGTATDVARRGEDGFWRYLIDNPFGAELAVSVDGQVN